MLLLGSCSGVAGPDAGVDGGFADAPVRMRTDGEYPVLEYDPRSESLIEPVGGGLTEVPLDFGTFLRRPLGRV
jgi:hypothetical protein